MIYVFLLAGGLTLGFLLLRRMQRAGGGGPDVTPAVRRAARRQDLRLRGIDPVIPSISSVRLCIAALAHAFARMDGTETAPDPALRRALEKHLSLDGATATDLLTLAPWVVAGGGGPSPAFDRLAKRLKQLDTGREFDRLMRVLGDVGRRGMPSAAQADALGALARIFRTA